MTTPAPDRASRRFSVREARLSSARASLKLIDENILALSGLTSLQVSERKLLGLTNQQQTDSSRSLVTILRANLLTLFNAVVGGSFLLLLALGQWKDALFGFAVVGNVVVGVTQEYRSKRTLDKLSVLNQPHARVRRNGEIVEIPLEEVVLDDLLELRASDQVPADGVIVETDLLEIDESLLTGEADSVDKFVGDTVLSGSGVISGHARVRVVRIGPETYASRITLEARRFSLVNSELRNSLAKIVRWITWALIPIMALVINGQMNAAGGWKYAIDSGAWLPAVVASIASIVTMIPQGLVLVTSIALAVAAVKLARMQVLVQELAAVEGLARVDIICFDKTGTLTEGDIVFDASHALPSENDSSGDNPEIQQSDWMHVLAYFGHDSNANATTRSLQSAFPDSHNLKAVASIEFSSVHKWSSFTFATGAGHTQTWVLGAPERVLTKFNSAHTRAREEAHHLAATGLRTLALAVTGAPHPAIGVVPADLIPVVLVTFRERVRGDAPHTLAYFREQGVSVRIISGDNPQTVAAVAREAGLDHPGEGCDATTLPKDIEALADVMENTQVFGRVTPDQKRDMVIAMQSRGHVVAMLGDGVNDALALKKADLGIAMGSGAAATKAVSNLILIDGNFSHLPNIVAEGRRVIANIERVSRLFLTKTSWAITLAIVFGIMMWKFPFLPRQLSAIDGYTIGLPAFALALLPNTRRYVPGFLKRSLLYCVPSGLIIGVAVIIMDMFIRNMGGWSEPGSQTATAFLLSITGVWVLTGLARPLDRWRLTIVVGMYVLFAGMFLVPLARDFFGFTWLSAPELAVPLAAGGIASFSISVVKFLVNRMTATHASVSVSD